MSAPTIATPPAPPSSPDAQLRNAEREFRAGRMSLEEFRQIEKVAAGAVKNPPLNMTPLGN